MIFIKKQKCLKRCIKIKFLFYTRIKSIDLNKFIMSEKICYACVLFLKRKISTVFKTERKRRKKKECEKARMSLEFNSWLTHNVHTAAVSERLTLRRAYTLNSGIPAQDGCYCACPKRNSKDHVWQILY